MSFFFRSSKVGRTQKNEIAEGFVTHLEKEQLKETMKISKLREIYRCQFSVMYETKGISFSDVLDALCFHLNICQQIQGKVVFGGGEEAALAMLDTDDEDDDWEQESVMHSFACDTCKKPMHDCHTLERHTRSIRHRQQKIFREIRKALEK